VTFPGDADNGRPYEWKDHTAMTIVAQEFDRVIGVDTHAKTHTYAITDAKTGQVLETCSYPTHREGLMRAVARIHNRCEGMKVLVAAECTGSYGANLTRVAVAAGLWVCEAKPPRKSRRGAKGKSDPIDAAAAATSVLGTDTDRLAKPRVTAHTYPALQATLAQRDLLTTHRTALACSLTALIRGNDLGIDARNPLTQAQITRISRWVVPAKTTDPDQVLRSIAQANAAHIKSLDKTLALNKTQLNALANEIAPGLQNEKGIGPVVAARLIASFAYPGRIRNREAFCKLAGTCPIPASSGNTIRHRLNRHGDRKLNAAITVIANTRIRQDEATQAYMAKCLEAGKTTREAKRSLKNHITRSLYNTLTTLMA
jgi:transposase